MDKKILIEGIIDSAMIRGVNGPDTSKELNLFVSIPWEYEHRQVQTYLWNLHLPMPYNATCGEQHNIIGRKIKVEVTIE